MIGQTFVHYQVLEKLGSGGMGEVYRARDTRLNRLVALKILRSDRMGDESRKQRFIQEAQSASALNHPNIISIYDIGQKDGVEFIVMEFVEGFTLDARIPRHGMRLNEALRIAVQIAEGLRCAHAAGIVHRDLKPSNIMIAGSQVKILDFGLAKLMEETTLTESDTLTIPPETEEGTIVGTTAYMSPEQAEGRKLDPRTDIFSFGIVLYEMLTGRRPFTGDSQTALLSSILKDNPKPPAGIPADLDAVIRRCLRKDREKRFQHIDDVKIALDDVREESESGTIQPVPQATSRRWRWVAAGALALLVVGLLAFTRTESNPAPALGPVMRQLTFDRGLTTDSTYWPAGKMIAYASDRAGDNLDIWIQNLGTNEAKRLTTHEADDREPSFSPDGSRIAFRSERDGGGIYVMSSLGVGERKIADRGRSPKFSPDGNSVAFFSGMMTLNEPYARNKAALYITPSTGGSPRRLVQDFHAISEPVWSADGKALLIFGGKSVEETDWYVVPVDNSSPTRTGAVQSLTSQGIQPLAPVAWDGEIVLFPAALGDANNLWRVRIDPRTFTVSERAQRLTTGNSRESHATLAGGQLVFSSVQENIDIWSLPIDTNHARVNGEVVRVTDDIAPNVNASVSADGTRWVYQTLLGTDYQIVLSDFVSKQTKVIANVNSQTSAPRISRDGSLIAYEDVEAAQSKADVKEPNRVIRVMSASGGPSRVVCESCQLRNWGVDNESLVITDRVKSLTGFVNIANGTQRLFLPWNRNMQNAPRPSPDGRWILFYEMLEHDRSRLLLAPVRDTEVPVSDFISLTDGASLDVVAEFSQDGKTVYFLSRRDGFSCHWAIRVDPATGRAIGSPFAIQHYHSARRSPGYVRGGRRANAVAPDKILFTMAERSGNIWMANLQ